MVPPVTEFRRMTFFAIVAIATATSILPELLWAQTILPDPAHGQNLAQKLCANCHVVPPNAGKSTNTDIPSFAAIASLPNANAEYLAGRIIIPHQAMPDTKLTVAELRDIIAYILTLKPTR